MMLINCYPYRYIIDASSILSQRNDEPNRRSVNKSLWRKIDDCMGSGIVVTCQEVFEEVQDEELKRWMKTVGLVVLPTGYDVQEQVKKSLKSALG